MLNEINTHEHNINNRDFRILVVDDSATAREVLRQRMTGAGYEVILAVNGAEAIEILSKDRDIDLILLDVLMPVMGGIEACEKIKSDKSITFIPILMQTIEDDVKDIVTGLDAGADDYVSKNAKPEEFLARVRACLRIKYYHDELQKAHRKLEEAGKLFASMQTAAQIGDGISANLNRIKEMNPPDEISNEVDDIWDSINDMLNRLSTLYDSFVKNIDEKFVAEESLVEEL